MKWLKKSWQRFSRIGIPLAMLLGSGVAPAPVMALDIMPLGDSITGGFNACSYRTPLVQSLDNLNSCNYTMVGTVSSPINPPAGVCTTSNKNHEGHGGWATTNFLTVDPPSTITRFSTYLNANTPDVVLFHIGTNDMGDGTGSKQVGTYNTSTNQGTFTIGRIVTMIDGIYAKNGNARIFMADLIPVTSDAWYNGNISQLRSVINTMVTDRASDGDDITLVPVSAGYTSAMMQDDGIHPNSTGEAHIAAKFLAAMQSKGICSSSAPTVPPAVNKISPTGTISTNTPNFQWQASSTATGYYLWVNDATGIALQTNLTPANANCSSGTGNCSFTAPSSIYGSSRWWVRASNSAGNGDWGGYLSFATPAGTVPGKVTLVSPVSGTAAASPQFRWNAQSNATQYYLWVSDSSGVRVQQRFTTSQSQCASGTGVCQATPGVSLNNGTVAWWVQASSGAGTGPWSAGASFYIGTAPAAATLLQPSGSGSGSSPTYSWNAVPNATYYKLWVNEGGTNRINQWYTAAQVCSGSSCSINSPISTSGSRSWWIQTWNPAGNGPWSARKDFN